MPLNPGIDVASACISFPRVGRADDVLLRSTDEVETRYSQQAPALPVYISMRAPVPRANPVSGVEVRALLDIGLRKATFHDL
jgi:hypothetical protein